MIKEERENIIANQNTAQDKFLSIIEKLSKPIKKVEILERLEGDLDLNVFQELNLGIPEEIYFQEGKITRIKNIPEGVKRFECVNNLLIELENLPITLEYLNLEFNYIESLNVSSLKNLEILNVSNNKLKELKNFPQSLIELKCTHNSLESINLKDISNLKTLHISNNLITVIENLPDSLIDFQRENLPSVELRNSQSIKETNNEEIINNRKRKDFYKNLKEYFKIKSKYEAKEKEMKRRLYKNAETKKMAKKAVKEFKMPCVKCKRKVGTLFQKKDNQYIAICGDDENPCSLNIKLYAGNHERFLFELSLYKEVLDDIKTDIIKEKLDNVFGYTPDETAKLRYENKLNEYNDYKRTYSEVKDEYNVLFENPEKTEEIKQKKRELFKHIDENREIMEEFKQTNNKQLLKDYVSNNINNIQREARNLRYLENEIIEVNHYKDENVFQVFKSEVALNKLESNAGEPLSVISFIR